MAAVTLANLMDPLKKIEAAALETNEKLDSLIAVSTGSSDGGGMAIMSELQKQTQLLSIIAGVSRLNEENTGKSAFSAVRNFILARRGAKRLAKIQTDGDYTNKLLNEVIRVSEVGFEEAGASGKNFGNKAGGGSGNKGGEGDKGLLKTLGIGSIKTAMGMTLWAIVPKKGVDKFVDFITRTFEQLANQDTKKAKEGINNLQLMGGAILSFAMKLALSVPFLIIGAIGIPILYAVTALVVPLFLLLGKFDKTINKGARSLTKMGMGLQAFSIGLGVFALVSALVMIGGPMLMLTMVASLVLIGGAVALLGLFNKQVNKGSVSLALMGVGLVLFGVGYGIFALAVMMTAPTPEKLAMQAGVLIGLGISVAILGAVFSLIIQGSIALALMGVGLLVFGIGYIPFAYATKDVELGDIGIQAALLLALGVVFAAAGFGMAFIIGGAVAIAVMGLGLLVFGIGYTPFAKATEGASLDSIAIQAGVLTALGVVFGVAGVAVIPIVAGAVAFGAVGLALQELAPGLKAMQDVDFTQKDALNLTTTLAGVKMAFIGPPKGGGVSGFFKSIGGAITGTIDAGAMTAAAIGFGAAGLALTKLSVGLKDYQKLEWTADDSLQLTTVLTGITGAFAAAGGEAATPTGLFGAVFGNAFSPNATKKGIDSVMGAGKALTSIAVGLTEFQKLVDKDVDFVVLGEAISKTVGFVQRAFAAVAEEGNVEAGGFFGSLFGIKKNKVQEGLQSVEGAGSALKDIAIGLTEFQKLVKSEVDFQKVGEAISMSIGFVQEAFAAVADQGNVKAGGFWGSLLGIKKNKVQEGVQSVQGAGDELSKIATALSTFSGIKDPAAVASKIKQALGMVGSAFASIGGKENEETDGNWFISWDENKIQKGIQAVDGAGAALTDIAAGLKAFSGDFQPEQVAASVGKLLTSIGTAFSDLYAANPMVSYQLRDFKSFIVTLGDVADKGSLDKAADGISKIADSISKIDIDKAVAFGDLFKSASTLGRDKRAYVALAKAVEDIREMMQKAAEEEKGPDKYGFAAIAEKMGLGAGAGRADLKGGGKAGGDMKALNSTLSQLSAAITDLPISIASMELVVTDPNR